MLAIAVGKRSAKVNSATFTRPARGAGQLTVKLAGHKVKLFTLTGRARVKRGADETISGLTAKLTKPRAARLDRVLHRHVFSTGGLTVIVPNTPQG